MNLPETLRGDLKRIVNQQPLFSLMNYYKGVPISYAASLRGFDLSSATVGVHPYQAVCMQLEGHTRVQSKLLSLAVQAQVTLNLKNNTARLSEFKRVLYVTERRQFVRIEPDQRIEVEVSTQNWMVRGRLEDISAVNIGIFLPGEEIFFEPEVVFKEYNNLRARLTLPGIDQPLEINGVVARSLPDKNHDYRVGARLLPNTAVQQAIRTFILKQQNLVEHELQHLYEQMQSGKN